MQGRALVFMVLLGGMLDAGCQVSCESACKKIIVECEAGIPSYNVTQCEEDCSEVQTEYEAEDYNDARLEAFKEQLRCINKASCEELLDPDAPACYDDSLFVF